MARPSRRPPPLPSQRPPPLLVLAAFSALALAIGIALLWLRADVQWQPPPALAPDASTLAAHRVPERGTAADALAAMSARPLFAATRRPPEAVAAEAPPAADPFAGARLIGTAGRDAAGVAIIDHNGQRRRVSIGSDFEGWKLVALEGSTARFQHGEQRHELTMQHAVQRGARAAPNPAESLASAGDDDAQAQAAAVQSARQATIQRIAESRARRQAARAAPAQ